MRVPLVSLTLISATLLLSACVAPSTSPFSATAPVVTAPTIAVTLKPDATAAASTSIAPAATTPAASKTPTPQETAMPALTPTAPAAHPGNPPATYPLFGHAADWSWIAGRILPTTGPSSCLAFQYDASGTTIALAALPQGLNDTHALVLFGQQASADGTACAGRKPFYQAYAGQTNPAQAPANQTYAHTANYTTLSGQYLITRIQGGCTYLLYDPSASDAYGGRFAISALSGFADGAWITVSGHVQTEGPHEMCPGQAYIVTQASAQK